MSIRDDEVVQSLTMLARLFRDSLADYQVAADAADSKQARRICAGKALERATMLGEIEEALLCAGAQPPRCGTPAAAAYRDWFVVKAELTPDSRVVPLLEECERSEDEAKAAFEQVLTLNLPRDLRGLIERHYDQVLSTHHQIRDLRDRRRVNPRAR